jgi:hypothetical protein
MSLNNTTYQMDLTAIYRVFQTAVAEYTFFSAAQGSFSTIDHILGHKASFNQYKKTEITSCILPDLNEIKVEINRKRICRKYTNTWILDNIFFNDQWVIEEIREEIKKFLESNEN